MTGKHYDWHKRWTVDLTAGSATHDSGLVVRFLLLPPTEAQIQAHESDTAIGKCWTPDGREWGAITTPELMQATFDALKEKNGPHNAQQMLARLAREAGEVWAWHKAREH